MEQTKPWKVGDLAQLTGLTVRTLHHWDELGLISPPRTGSGHRCYSGADVARLYQVIALKQIGLGPDQIAVLFAGEAPAPRMTLRWHLDVVEADLWHRQELRDRLVRIFDALDHEDADIDVQLLLKVIEKMTMFENQLTASNANGSPDGASRSAKTGGRRH
jgi:DNA-binding transcriptional MerR regulator